MTETIKSAKRVLEVLELFAQTHAPATVTEVSERLGYPQSSTSMLLASLEALGYLQLDRATRSYRPTLRVMLLGNWMHDELFSEGSLLSAMEQLRQATGMAVMIGLRQGTQVRFILSLRAPVPNALQYPVGIMRPVCRSALGKVLLALESDAEVERIARRANAEASDPADVVVIAELLREVRACRSNRWAETLDYPRPGRGMLAMQLPRIEGQPAMGIALGTRKEQLAAKRDKLVAALVDLGERLEQERARLFHGSPVP